MKILLFVFSLSLIIIQVYGQNPIKIQSKSFTPRQLHKDIDYTLKKFEQIHPDIYREIPKDSVIKRFSALKARITKPMSRFDFLNIFTPVAFTIIHDGHNYVFPLEKEFSNKTTEYNDYIYAGGRLFPIPVVIQNRKLYCNSVKTEIPFDSEITQINQMPVREVIETILGGYTAESDEFEESVNSDWFSNAYWQSFGGFDKYKIKYKLSIDTTQKELTLNGLVNKQLDSIRQNSKIASYEFEEITDLQTAVLKYNSAEIDQNAFKLFCDSIFQIIKIKNYKNLIIDIRQNTGGTTRSNDLLFEYITNKAISQVDSSVYKSSKERKKDFVTGNRRYAGWFKWYNYLYYPIYIRTDPSRKEVMTAKNGTFHCEKVVPAKPKDNPLKFNGKLFLLTSKKTYSAAMGFAAAFKCYSLGLVIGQETGNPTVCTTDWAGFILPNTKIKCAVSEAKIYFACGKEDGHGVIPDYIIENDYSLKDSTDKEMDFVKQLIIKNNWR